MIAQYKAVDKEVTLYGLDFFDADGNPVTDIEFGTDEAACAEFLTQLDDDHSPLWPETAVRVQPYTRQAIQTNWLNDGYADPYRRHSTGRFASRGHS